MADRAPVGIGRGAGVGGLGVLAIVVRLVLFDERDLRRFRMEILREVQEKKIRNVGVQN